MNDQNLCVALVSLLLGALMASPIMVYWMQRRERRRNIDRRRRRPPEK
jgi:uncharacterized iron-regulated membrane protein